MIERGGVCGYAINSGVGSVPFVESSYVYLELVSVSKRESVTCRRQKPF